LGSSCATARCWIIGAQKDGFSRENPERTFPGATIKVYSRPNFVKRMQLKGRPREAFEIIKARLNGTNEGRAAGQAQDFSRSSPRFVSE
jgi:hypothetical protein